MPGHLVLAEESSHVCVVDGQSTSYFVHCKAELKQLHDQKPLCGSCSRTELQLFMFCSQTQISTSLVPYCFCIIRTTCPSKIWSLGHFVLQDAQKMCSTDTPLRN